MNIIFILEVDKVNFCMHMQMSMNVILGRMGVITNATTHWEAFIVHATPHLIWILMEGPAFLVCSVLR